MKNLITMLITVLLWSVAMAGCTSNDTSAIEDAREERDDAVAKAKQAAQEAAAAFERGYAEAEAKYNPPRTEVANRTSKNTLDVEAGRFSAFIFTVPREAVLEYSVLQYAGPRFDIIVTEGAETELCETGCLGTLPDGSIVDELDSCSDWDTASITRTCKVPPGTWQLILENGDVGGAEPDPEGEDETLRLRLTYRVTVVERAEEPAATSRRPTASFPEN